MASFAYLSDEILQFFSTSLEMGRLGTGLVSFLSILPLVLGTITGGGFFVGGGDMVRVLTSQSLVDAVLPFGDTLLKYLASPPLFLCTVAGLRNSDELFATSTDMLSLLFFLICESRWYAAVEYNHTHLDNVTVITLGCCGLIWVLKYSVIFPWDSW